MAFFAFRVLFPRAWPQPPKPTVSNPLTPVVQLLSWLLSSAPLPLSPSPSPAPMRSVVNAEPLFRQRVAVIELKAAPEDVMKLAYGRLLAASEHLFAGRRNRNSAPLNIAHLFTVKGQSERERDGEQGLWQSPPEPPSPHLQEIAG